MKYYFLFIYTTLILFSCKSKESNTIQEKHQLPDSFVEFYIQFHTDSIYQMNHIIFPLEGIPPLTDSLIQAEDFKNFKWQKEDWVLHRNMTELENNFKREYQEYGGIIIETINHSSNAFSMTRRFAQLGDDWHLIYYAAMNPN